MVEFKKKEKRKRQFLDRVYVLLFDHLAFVAVCTQEEAYQHCRHFKVLVPVSSFDFFCLCVGLGILLLCVSIDSNDAS